MPNGQPDVGVPSPGLAGTGAASGTGSAGPRTAGAGVAGTAMGVTGAMPPQNTRRLESTGMSPAVDNLMAASFALGASPAARSVAADIAMDSPASTRDVN